MQLLAFGTNSWPTYLRGGLMTGGGRARAGPWGTGARVGRDEAQLAGRSNCGRLGVRAALPGRGRRGGTKGKAHGGKGGAPAGRAGRRLPGVGQSPTWKFMTGLRRSTWSAPILSYPTSGLVSGAASLGRQSGLIGALRARPEAGEALGPRSTSRAAL